MKTVQLKLPEVGLLAMTRVIFGAGLGLLVSPCLDEKQRRAAGTALLLVGVVTTIPFAVQFFGEKR